MADVSQAFIQAFTAGRQVRQAQDAVARQAHLDERQAQLDAEAAEDRKLEREGLKIRLQTMKLEEKMRPRLAAQERIKFLETLGADQVPPELMEPRPDGMGGLSALIAGARPETAGNAMPAAVRTQAATATATPLQFKPQTVPGVDDLGLPTETIRPRTVQEVLAESIRKERMSLLMKPITAKPGEKTVIPLTGEVIAEGGEAPPASDMERQIKILSDEFEATHGRAPNATEKAGLLRDSKQLARDPQLDALNLSIKQLQLETLKKAKDAGTLTPVQFSMASRLADDYTAASKDYLTRLQSLSSIRTAATDPSAAGDLALIFGFMRMLDPNSTVRESEFANAQNAAGVPARIRNAYNKAVNGERLNPDQRADFLKQSETQFEQAQKRQSGLIRVYTARATTAKVPANMVVIDYDKAFGGDGEAAVVDEVPAGVATVLKGAGSGRHTLSDGTIWLVAADGSIQRVKQ